MKSVGRFLICITTFAALVSCGSNRSKDNEVIINDTPYFDVTSNERDYLTRRDALVEKLQGIQKKKSGVDDSLQNADRLAIAELEVQLKGILVKSRFADTGEINLNTLLGFLDYGLLDGLRFSKDSLHIFYTTKNLFTSYFKTSNHFDKLSSKDFESIFQSAYQFDADVTDFSTIRINATDSIESYGMVAGLSQVTGRLTPQYLYVLVSLGDFVYIAEKELKKPINEIPKCISVWDSLVSKSSQPVDDIMFDKYCDCYRKELKNDIQFSGLEKQFDIIVSYLVGQ